MKKKLPNSKVTPRGPKAPKGASQAEVRKLHIQIMESVSTDPKKAAEILSAWISTSSKSTKSSQSKKNKKIA